MFFRKLTLVCAVLALSISLSGCEKPEEKSARYLKRGNELFAQGEYAKARVEFKNAARILPTAPEPFYHIGLVDEVENHIQNAFGNFGAAEQQNPRYAPALLKLSHYFIAAGEYDEAFKRLKIVLADNPNDAQAHALQAAIMLKQKFLKEGEKEAQIALQLEPANLTAIAVLTGVYSAQNDEAKAVATLDEGIRHNPGELSLLLLRVMLFERSGNVDKIAESYEPVFKLKPEDAGFRADLARVYLSAGRLKEAEKALRDGIAATPDNWMMKRELVYFLGENLSMEAAQSEVSALHAAHPDHNELLFWMANLYAEHKQTARAEELLVKVIAAEQDSALGMDSRTTLARLQLAGGNKDKAEKLVSAALETDGDNRDALFLQAQMAFDDGRYQASVADLRTIIRDDLQAKNAMHLLAETLLLQGHLNLAIDTQSQLVETDPGNIMAVVRLAQMHLLNHNPEQAMQMLATATRIDPDYPMVWETTARAAIEARDWKAAQDAIARLQEKPSQELLAMFLRGMMLDAEGKPQEALPLYMQVIKEDPAHSLAEHAMSAYVQIRQKEGKLPETVTELAALQPQTPFIHTLRGGVLSQLGRKPEAAQAFEQAIAAGSASADPYLALAHIQLEAGEREKAIATLRKGMKAARAEPHIPLLLASILSEQGNHAAAADEYEKLIEGNPQLDAAANNYAQLVADHLHTDEARLEKARQVAERFTNASNPLLLDTLGWVYFRQGKLQESLVVMEKALKLGGEQPAEMHYHYGSLLKALGRTEEARAELQKAVASEEAYAGKDDAVRMMKGF